MTGCIYILSKALDGAIESVFVKKIFHNYLEEANID